MTQAGQSLPFPPLLSALGTPSPGCATAAGLPPAALRDQGSAALGMLTAQELQMKGSEGQNLLVWAQGCGSAKPAEVTVTFV